MRVIGMDHIVVNTSDVDEALRFYGDILGLEVLRLDQFRRGEVGFVSVRLSGETIIDLRPSENTLGGPVNVDHFCLFVEPTDMEAALEDLRSKGVEISGPVGSRWGARGNGPSFYVKAPDGNRIELKAYSG